MLANKLLKLSILIGIGIGMTYGFILLGSYAYQLQTDDLNKYCPGWIEDHTKPCGMTDGPTMWVSPMIALCIVCYALLVISWFLNYDERPSISTKSQSGNQESKS